MLLRFGIDLAKFAERFDDHRHDLSTLVDMSHFAATELNAYLHLVFMLQELFRLADFGANIFFACLGTQSDFFGLGMCVTRVLFLVLVVFEFAVIHDSANRWSLVGSDFDKV